MDRSLQAEIRAMIPKSDLIIMDMYCAATGTCRNELVIALILDWSQKKSHEATLICRGARINPQATDLERNDDFNEDKGD